MFRAVRDIAKDEELTWTYDKTASVVAPAPGSQSSDELEGAAASAHAQMIISAPPPRELGGSARPDALWAAGVATGGDGAHDADRGAPGAPLACAENAGHAVPAKRPADEQLEPGSPRARSRGKPVADGPAGAGGPGEGGRQRRRLDDVTSARRKAEQEGDEEGASPRESAVSFTIEEMVVLARQGEEPLTPGVTMRPRTEDQKRMARRWPTQPLVLWHVPKKKPVVGSATECVPVDTAFDEAAYCDTHVEAARQLEFVEQLQWARNYVSLQRDIDDAPAAPCVDHGGHAPAVAAVRTHEHRAEATGGCAVESEGPGASPVYASGHECPEVWGEARNVRGNVNVEGPTALPGAQDERSEMRGGAAEEAAEEAVVTVSEWGPEEGTETSGLGVEGAAVAWGGRHGGGCDDDDGPMDMDEEKAQGAPHQLVLAGKLSYQTFCLGVYRRMNLDKHTVKVGSVAASGPIWRHESKSLWLVKTTAGWAVKEEQDNRLQKTYLTLNDKSARWPHQFTALWKESDNNGGWPRTSLTVNENEKPAPQTLRRPGRPAGSAGKSKCSICGEPGHYRTTCPQYTQKEQSGEASSGEDATVNEKDATVNEKDATVNEKDATVNEKDATGMHGDYKGKRDRDGKRHGVGTASHNDKRCVRHMRTYWTPRMAARRALGTTDRMCWQVPWRVATREDTRAGHLPRRREVCPVHPRIASCIERWLLHARVVLHGHLCG